MVCQYCILKTLQLNMLLQSNYLLCSTRLYFSFIAHMSSWAHDYWCCDLFWVVGACHRKNFHKVFIYGAKQSKLINLCMEQIFLYFLCYIFGKHSYGAYLSCNTLINGTTCFGFKTFYKIIQSTYLHHAQLI